MRKLNHAMLLAAGLLCAQPIPGAAAAAPPAAGVADAASSQRITQAAAGVREIFEAASVVTGSFPGAAVIVATGYGTPEIWTYGVTHAGGAVAVSADTPFYIASNTKSYVGLLAARLDQKGVLPLDTTLAQVWPALKLPGGLDPTTISMRDLLSHQAPLKTDTLNFRTAYTDDVPAAAYPELIGRYTTAREPGFSYSNLGYLIYGAALEARTGNSWRWWLQQEVLGPLGLTHTAARTSVFGADTVVWRHQWSGSGWYAYPPKDDATMHAAGGLVSSPSDLARWIQAHLRAEAGMQDMNRAMRLAQSQISTPNAQLGPIFCDGYGLGWMRCTYKGRRLLMHSGEYSGARALIMIAPEFDVGIAIVTNSDSMTGTLGQESALLFVDMLAGDPEAPARKASILQHYAGGPGQLARSRAQSVDDARNEPGWAGWTWRPTEADLAGYVGRFVSPRLGTMEISRRTDGALMARIGALHLNLTPAKPGMFGAQADAFSLPEAFQYSASRDTITWDDDTFQRQP